MFAPNCVTHRLSPSLIHERLAVQLRRSILIPDNWRVVHSPAFSLNLVEQVARFLWSTVITRRFVETRVECNGNESATMNGHANVVALRRKRHSLTPLRVGASTLQRRTESARVCYFLPLSSSRGSRACQDSPRSHGTSLSRLRWSRQTVGVEDSCPLLALLLLALVLLALHDTVHVNCLRSG